MTQTIVVPPGEEGDEVIKQLVPHLYQMAKAEQRARRSQQ